jgi:putative ABC transport system ATP-binding protein
VGEPLFRFDAVGLRVDEVVVLSNVTAVIPDDGVTVLAGPSGAGKSTVLRLCNRLAVPTSGSVLFRGDDVADLDPLHLRRRVGMVFQRPTLFAGSVRDNLRVALPDGDDATFADALARAGLGAEFLGRTGDDLSGGEAQRACLARTLVTRPEVLLMDEPTSALDPANTRRLEGLARDLAADGVAVLWVSHDLEQVDRVADRTIVLVAGRMASAAEAEAFLEDTYGEAASAGRGSRRSPSPGGAGMGGAP